MAIIEELPPENGSAEEGPKPASGSVQEAAPKNSSELKASQEPSSKPVSPPNTAEPRQHANIIRINPALHTAKMVVPLSSSASPSENARAAFTTQMQQQPSTSVSAPTFTVPSHAPQLASTAAPPTAASLQPAIAPILSNANRSAANTNANLAGNRSNPMSMSSLLGNENSRNGNDAQKPKLTPTGQAAASTSKAASSSSTAASNASAGKTDAATSPSTSAFASRASPGVATFGQTSLPSSLPASTASSSIASTIKAPVFGNALPKQAGQLGSHSQQQQQQQQGYNQMYSFSRPSSSSSAAQQQKNAFEFPNRMLPTSQPQGNAHPPPNQQKTAQGHLYSQAAPGSASQLAPQKGAHTSIPQNSTNQHHKQSASMDRKQAPQFGMQGAQNQQSPPQQMNARMSPTGHRPLPLLASQAPSTQQQQQNAHPGHHHSHHHHQPNYNQSQFSHWPTRNPLPSTLANIPQSTHASSTQKPGLPSMNPSHNLFGNQQRQMQAPSSLQQQQPPQQSQSQKHSLSATPSIRPSYMNADSQRDSELNAGNTIDRQQRASFSGQAQPNLVGYRGLPSSDFSSVYAQQQQQQSQPQSPYKTASIDQQNMDSNRKRKRPAHDSHDFGLPLSGDKHTGSPVRLKQAQQAQKPQDGSSNPTDLATPTSTTLAKVPPPKAPKLADIDFDSNATSSALLDVRNKLKADQTSKHLGTFVWSPLVGTAEMLPAELLDRNLGANLSVSVDTRWLGSTAWSLSTDSTTVYNAVPQNTAWHAVFAELQPCRDRAVWGTNVYTDDSDVLMMAIHSGKLIIAHPPTQTAGTSVGKKKSPRTIVVDLQVAPRLINYQGTSRAGVRSRSWGNGHDGVSLIVTCVRALNDNLHARQVKRLCTKLNKRSSILPNDDRPPKDADGHITMQWPSA